MRELVMLAKKFSVESTASGQDVCGWLMSEKLDGHRCFWDGGVSRGDVVRGIPWSNKGNKHRVVGRATGLWTRYGNVVCAPAWFLDELPVGICLDGELWLARGCRQELKSIVSRLEPDERWRGVSFCVFEAPSLAEWCVSGVINGPHFSTTIDAGSCKDYVTSGGGTWTDSSMAFTECVSVMQELSLGPHMKVVNQVVVPYVEPLEFIHERMNDMMKVGGEGLMLRHPHSYWVPARSNHLLKVKQHHDSEARVVGYTAGIGDLRGMLGALVVVTVGDPSTKLAPGVRFELAGFNKVERCLVGEVEDVVGGNEIPTGMVVCPAFPLESVVTFRYAGLSDGGVPIEARIWR